MPVSEADYKKDKLYYSIGEVSRIFDVNASLIRFWEKEFKQIKPKKNKKGNRLFTQKDIANFRLIYSLVKEQGYTLEGAKQKLKEKKEDGGPDGHNPVIERLERIKVELLDLKDRL